MQNYKESYEKDFERYQQLLAEYKKTIEDTNFIMLQAEVPYKFIAAKSIYETMAYFAEEKYPINFGFKDFNDVYVFYRNFISLKSEINSLLDSAVIIDEVYKKETQLNLAIKQSQFLADEMCVHSNSRLFTLTSEILRNLPRYRDVFTPEFRFAILSSAVSNISKADIGKLIDTNILKADDLPLITIENNAETKRKEIQEAFAERGITVSIKPEKEFNLKIKGVTFEGTDGSNRQDNLKALSEYVKAHDNESVALKVEAFTYTPDLKQPEVAYRVLWQDKELGVLDSQTAKELSTKYKPFTLTANLSSIKGGDDGLSFGAEIKLIASYEKDNEEKEIKGV